MDLSPLEFDLLLYLVRASGRVVSRDSLMRYVWKYATGVASRTIDQHIARLRHKLEPEPLNPRHILTVRKAGYRIEKWQTLCIRRGGLLAVHNYFTLP